MIAYCQNSYLSYCLNKKISVNLPEMGTDKITCMRIFADQDQIQSCRQKLAEYAAAFSRLGKILELSGNEVRLKILYLLDQEKELCPCDISDILGMSIAAISQHLRKLKDGSVIESRRSGQTIYYSLRREHLATIEPFFQLIQSANQKAEVL
jgi:DNA-binding transcriptional ArsR family regulator